MVANNVAGRDLALKARLELVVRDHSQAKLARVTGRSRTALTRYMQGAKIPLEFGGALSAELAVNPAWLLTGNGPMYVTDLPAASTELGRDLLELIRTMDAVAAVKVGSLAGKSQAHGLREISDSLALYGSLRERLHTRTVPVLAELVEQIEQALNRRQYDRASSLAETAAKVERFTDDLVLTRRLMQARAHILHVRQQSDQAIEIESQLFHALLGSGAPFASVASSASLLAVTLRSASLSGRARRAVRMARSCADADDERTVDYAILLSQEVMASVELGEMQGLHPQIEQAMEHAPKGSRSYADTAKLFYYVHSGILAPSEVAGAPHNNFPAAAMVLSVAMWTEDADLVERALGPVRALCNPQMPLNLLHLETGERLLAVLRGKHGGAAVLDEMVERARGMGKRWQSLGDLTSLTQVLRLAGDPRAVGLLPAAQDMLDNFPPERAPWPIAVARHLRNVLKGIPPDTRNARNGKLRQRAERLCNQRIAQGYGMLRELLAVA